MRKQITMEFDLTGHLSPYTIIQTSIDEFEAVLVNAFPTNSTRHTIFKGYKEFILNLKHIVGLGFYQWIDGSFVTDEMNPNDIDIVTFLDFERLFNNEQQLIAFLNKESKSLYKVDAAFVPIFPQNHKLRYITEWDSSFWKDFYGKTRPDAQNKAMMKGFIQLNF